MFRLKTLSLAVAGTVALNSCMTVSADSASGQVLPISDIVFTPTPAPTTDAERTSAYTRSSAIITLPDGRRKTVPLDYRALYSSGEQIGNWRAGTIVDQSGAPLAALVDDTGGVLANGPFYARSPDGNSLIRQGDGIHLVTHFEYDTDAASAADPSQRIDLYGQLPMVMNLARLEQGRDGRLVATDLSNISMNAVNGLWIPCAGELTPWNTHIGGEEYEPDARTYENRPLTPMNRFLAVSNLTASQGGANAYHYGVATEVRVGSHDATTVTKHYAMGRLSNELAHVMPDRRTAYKGDDGRDVILTMFVADRADDLSAGILYAAQLTQLDGANGGKFNLRWIRLGHASDAEVQSLIDRGIKFSDIFEVVSKADYQTNPSAYPGFRPVFVYTGTDGTDSNRLTYLRVKAGMEQAAAFLETRRYAAYQGATAEFTKMEGETSNAAAQKLYIAMSYVERAMLDGQNADRPRDDIRLTDDPKDLACGIVYESNLKSDQRDTDGNLIDSRWVATDLGALVRGAKKPAGQAYGKYDSCDTDKLANPDNIKYSEALRTLFIGEDSGNHMNNFLWAYSLDHGTLTRIATTRFGAEWTGLAAIDNLNGFAYILGNIQHPGATEDTAKYKPLMQADGIDFEAFRARVDQRGAVGYLGGLPAVQVVGRGARHDAD